MTIFTLFYNIIILALLYHFILNYLDFEKEIKALEKEVDTLKPFGSEGISEVDTNKIKNTQLEINQKLEEIYSTLTAGKKLK